MAISTSISSLPSARLFKPALIGVGVIGLLLLGLLLVPRLLDINSWRGPLTGQLEQRLGRSVKLGALSLSVLPSVKVRVDDAVIGDDPAVAPGEFVKAKAVRLQLGLLSLLRGKPQVAGLELTEPDVTLINAGGGKWNWSTLKLLQTNEPNAEVAPFDLLVRNGRFTLIDCNTTPPVEKTYTGVNLTLDDFSPHRSFAFVVGLTMPGAQAGKLEVEGTTGPFDRQDAAQTPLDARVKLEQVELQSLEALFGQPSARAGRVTLDAKLAGKLAAGLAAQGTLKAEQLRLVKGVEPARAPLAADFKLVATTKRKSNTESEFAVKLEQCALKLGRTMANVAGQINGLPASPTIDLQINGDRIALDDLLESAYAFGFGPPAGTKASGAATIKLRATGELKALALNGQAGIRDLKFQTASIPQPVQVSELKLNFAPQSLTAAPFNAKLSRTTVEFSGLKVTDYAKQPRAHLEVSAAAAQLDDLLHIAESFGARPNATGTGNVAFKAVIDTNLNAPTRAMTINGQGKLTGASVQSATVKQPLEIANADIGFSGNSFRIDNLSARFGQSQGGGWLAVQDFDQPAATFDLNVNQLLVAELQQAMAAPADAQTKQSAHRNLRADGQISIGKLVLNGITATDARGKVELRNQTIKLDPLTLKLYGGSYQGQARLDQASSELALSGRFDNLNLNQFLSAAGQKSMIHGRADGSINLRGQGNGGEALVKSLVGAGALAVSDGKLTSFDLMKQVEVLGKVVKLPTGGADTAFRSLKTNLRFERGRLVTDALQLVMDDLQVSGDGSLGLGEPVTANYELLARLSPTLTQRVLPTGGGERSNNPVDELIRLGGKLVSKVGNFFIEQDGLVVPIRMSGPLTAPVFSLNSAVLEKRAQERFKERLDKNVEKARERKPEDLLKGVLDIFKQKKP